MDTIYIARKKDDEEADVSSVSDNDDCDIHLDTVDQETPLVDQPPPPSSSSPPPRTIHKTTNMDEPPPPPFFPDHYLERLRDYRQWDIQTALFELKSLLSRPTTVYRTANYRFETKGRYCRDDPAFLVVQVLTLIIASIGYTFAFRVPSMVDGLLFVLSNVGWHWLGAGVLVAKISQGVSNACLRNKGTGRVELLYAFDIHCNAFVPILLCLYGMQFITLPILLQDGFIGLLVSDFLYMVAFSWYWYITHLGYRNLSFLEHTEVFLLPILVVFTVFVLFLIGYPFGMGYNITRVVARYYFM